MEKGNYWDEGNSVPKDSLGESQVKEVLEDFPSGAGDNNPPANRGHAGSISNWKDSTCWSNSARAPQLLSLPEATTKAQVPRACALQQEKPTQGQAQAPQ